jgi:excisionase family DNA binding protein
MERDAWFADFARAREPLARGRWRLFLRAHGVGGVTDFLLRLPDDALEQVARRAAEIVLASLPASSSESPFMTAKEAAAYLRCERQRIDDLLSQRRLTRFKEGGRTLVSRSEVEALAVAHELPRVRKPA